MAGDVREWLEGLGLGRYAETFAENDVEFRALILLDREDLKELGVSLGHRKIILAAIAALRGRTEAETPSPEAAPPPARTSEAVAARGHDAERRQLTVMFCDLVGSTQLSQRLDPEDLREVMRCYQDTLASVVARHEGHVANFLGDGVLAYFGWPQAHEGQAAQAVRAGLAAIEAMRTLCTPAGEALRARVGIASGQVVVGDLAGDTSRQADAIAGETPNVAARLQSVAAPGEVVISALTRQLLRGAFELESLGTHSLKGIAEPVPVWRVTGEREAEGRFEAMQAETAMPLLGRDHEIALVRERCRAAFAGEGQVMLLCGEPGIGKSRIVVEVRERLRDQPHIAIRYYCSPFFANTALYPVIVQIERAAKLDRRDSAGEKLEKIARVLAEGTPPDSEAAGLLADLLSIPPEGHERAVAYTPQQRKVKTFDVLVQQLERLAARQPVLMILEDAQWLDPTSVELFELFIERLQNLPVFFVVTYRPPFAPSWLGYPHVTLLTLNRLGRDQTAALAARVAGGKTLPDQVMNEILAKTDGVPLFIEELTKTVVESGLLEDAGDRYELGQPLPPLAIPATLQDSLLARLDRLATVKDVVQIAACIGREVPCRLLREVVGLDEPGLQAALERLVDADLLLRRGTGDEIVFIFRHSLLQETAHQTLLKSRRQQLHGRIATTLVAKMADVVNRTPEVVARHYTEAGLAAQAIDYWLQAARSAAARPAFKEALAHLDNGSRLLSHIADEGERTDREIELLLASGVALHASRGPVDAVRDAYSRACVLCREAGDDRRLYAGLWGLWFNSEQRMNFEEARNLATQLLELAGHSGDAELLLQAHHAAWTTYLYRGELGRCMRHAEDGRALYSVEHHHAKASIYSGHDAGVCCRYTAGLVRWLMGYPDSALAQATQSVALAEELAHPYTLALALTLSAVIRQCRGEVAETIDLADRVRALSEANGIAVFRASAGVMHGWGAAAMGDPASGVLEIREGLDALVQMGAGLRRSYFLWLLAEAYAMQGDHALTVSTLEQASAFAQQTGERWWRAEILRRLGEVRQSEGDAGAPFPENLFREAVAVAEEQGALSLKLRAATSWGWHCIAKGEGSKARQLVQPVYARMREGLETKDLRDARTLLEQLNP